MAHHRPPAGLGIALAAAWLGLSGPAAAQDPERCPRRVVAEAEARPVGPAVARSPVFSRAVVAELNHYRCRAGLPPVATDARAARTSAWHSAWMASAGQMTHDSNIRGRRSYGDRLEAEGIRVSVRAYENIAHLRHYSVEGLSCRTGRRIPTEGELAREVVRMWYGSPPHRRQMMAPEMTRAGGGAAASLREGTCGTLFLTLDLYT